MSGSPPSSPRVASTYASTGQLFGGTGLSEEQGITFNCKLSELSAMLTQLAKLHRQEVEEALQGNLQVRRKLTSFSFDGKVDIASRKAADAESWVSEANAIVPVEWQSNLDDVVLQFKEVKASDTGTSARNSLESTLSLPIRTVSFERNRVPERWAALVRQLNKPTIRVAQMKYVPLSIWTIANRERLLEEGMMKRGYTSFLEDPFVNTQSNMLMQFVQSNKLIQGICTCKIPIVNPNSLNRRCWLFACIMLTLYDVAMVPVIACFDINDSFASDDVARVMSWVSCVFWSMDIIANFSTGAFVAGALEMRHRSIAIAYIKGWFLFDVCLVISQWLTLLLSGSGSSVVVLRGLRLVRLLRLLRLGGLQTSLELLLNMHHEGVIVCGAMLKIACGILIIIHVQGCLWYAVGRLSDHGWAQDPVVVSNSISRNYVLSVQWAVAQVHGSSPPTALTTWEHAYATISLCLGFFLFTFVVANATLTVLQVNNVHRWKMQATCTRFCDSHNISQTLAARMQQYLALGHRRVGISEMVKDEAGLLAALPPSVRVDVIDEARWPLLKQLQVFPLLHHANPRRVRTICQAAISVSVALEQETVFDAGDPGKNVFIIQFGKFTYQSNHRQSQKNRQGTISMPGAWEDVFSMLDLVDGPGEDLARGSVISEAVLWTKWDHTGDLMAICDSTMLLLEPEIFVEVVKERQDMLYLVASYASKYVTKLNQTKTATDLFQFEVDAVSMQEEDELVSDKHLIFLSHYKAEAGTEATLIHEALTRMISSDADNPAINFKAPVFLDSANLQDLSLLREHVSNSNTLVLLLTPGVLTRPWCLVEIATALNQNVRIVPVEVQRPGISFSYPDEIFYQQLTSGKLLSAADESVLGAEGLELAEVERSLRHVFTQIAIPFSPHRSTQIRQAELSDILQRCMESWTGSKNRNSEPLYVSKTESLTIYQYPGRYKQ